VARRRVRRQQPPAGQPGRRQAGIILLMSLVTLTITATFILYGLSRSVIELQAAQRLTASQRAFYAAETGLMALVIENRRADWTFLTHNSDGTKVALPPTPTLGGAGIDGPTGDYTVTFGSGTVRAKALMDAANPSLMRLEVTGASSASTRRVMGFALMPGPAGGVITTVAGNGILTYAGDGGPATSASLYNPASVVLDGNWNLYIADSYNNRVRKVATDGTITTVAGTGTQGFSGDGGAATSAKLNVPTGLVLDSAGNLYIADANNNRIRKVNTSGTITTVAGTGTMGFSGDGGAATSARLNYPFGIALDSTGNLYIADRENDRVRKVDTSGIITTVAGGGTWPNLGDGGPATSALLKYPEGVLLDRDGNLYIADYGNGRIRKVAGAASVPTGGGSSGRVVFWGDVSKTSNP
jgi:sugar lactone lactonase YvrE